MSETAREKPPGNFGEYVESHAPPVNQSADKGAFPPAGETWSEANKWQLSLDKKPIGFLGQNSDQWCIVVPEVEKALRLKTLHHFWGKYFQNADNPERYLSWGGGPGYVGLYSWLSAASWRIEGDVLYLEDMGAVLTYWGAEDNFVYANRAKDGYKVLTVRFIPA